MPQRILDNLWYVKYIITQISAAIIGSRIDSSRSGTVRLSDVRGRARMDVAQDGSASTREKSEA